jgi:hypothetical protein
MRLFLLVCCAILAFAGALQGQPDESSAYSISIVKFALQMRSGGQWVIFSPTQRSLARLGDGVSIALLKLIEEQDLTSRDTARALLSIIRDAFEQPQLIEIDVDKEPKVTLFLLRYMQLRVSDSEVRRDIQETIDSVKAKTQK